VDKPVFRKYGWVDSPRIAVLSHAPAKTEADGDPPPLGLHTLMQETTGQKIGDMIKNITEGLVAPVEMIARKQ
jgi:hypothetical protein